MRNKFQWHLNQNTINLKYISKLRDNSAILAMYTISETNLQTTGATFLQMM